MKLHLVGGFLGSGKTTAIAAAVKQLVRQGQTVGVVTNDQGQLLVDTSFFRFLGVPTVAVVGSCFCCNYNELVAKLDELRGKINPAVVFAESVGSCADLVATVLKPLRELQNETVTVASFSVFVDVRLLRQRLTGQPLPFSGDIQYIFEKQLEEASLLVLNHCDEVPSAIAQETESLARRFFPDASLRVQNSLDRASVAGWLDLITAGKVPLATKSVAIDYSRYGAGEAELAWLDERITLTFAAGQGREVVRRLLEEIVGALRREQIPLAHLKCALESERTPAKISFTAFAAAEWLENVPEIAGTEAALVLNVRAQLAAARLRELVRAAVARVSGTESATHAFHPGFPRPTHRLA